MFKPKALTVGHVYRKLKEIAQLTGNKVEATWLSGGLTLASRSQSQQRKGDIIKSLLVSCQSHESRYLVRSLIGKLRIGLAEQSMLVALAHACVKSYGEPLTESNGKERLERGTLSVKDAFCQCPSYDILVDVLVRRGGLEQLPELCKATPGIPMKPMLAHPSKGIDEVLKRCGHSEFACEYKYDGERAQVQSNVERSSVGRASCVVQIHLTERGEIFIYSRNSENNTSKYPDVIERIPNALHAHVTSLIIDGECVAYDIEQKKLLPFQTLSTRKRKVNAWRALSRSMSLVVLQDADIHDIKVQGAFCRATCAATCHDVPF
jgi:DNA ligase 1